MHVRIAFMALNEDVSEQFVAELLLSTQYRVEVSGHTRVNDETLDTINVLDLEVHHTDLVEFMKYATTIGSVLRTYLYDEYFDWLEQFAGTVYPDHYEVVVMVPETATGDEWAQLTRWMSLSQDVLKRSLIQSGEQIQTLNTAMKYCVGHINNLNENIKSLNHRTAPLAFVGEQTTFH